MNIFERKKILIISPQPWSNMKVSKHHYAIELQRRGNQVYFLNPPSINVKRGRCLITDQTNEGIIILNYRPTFPMRWKTKLLLLFNLFIRLDVKKIISAIGSTPDIVWDFEPTQQFANLGWFNAKLKIYHPVDISPYLSESTKNADIVFSVSENILNFFRHSKTPFYFINHGISEGLEKLAKKVILNTEEAKKRDKIQIGYIGNLLMEHIDHNGFMRIINDNPELRFEIWGPYLNNINVDSKSINLKITNFIRFLSSSPNVILHGIQSQDVILTRLNSMDAFFWCYNNDTDPNKGSNSHKVLEYLSTGKVTICTNISTYSSIQNENIIIMGFGTSDFVNKFNSVVKNLSFYNSSELQIKRAELALNNTYGKQLTRIEALISEVIYRKKGSLSRNFVDD